MTLENAFREDDKHVKGYPRSILNGYWFEIVIDDDLFLSGDSLIKLFRIIQVVEGVKYIFCAGLDGAPLELQSKVYDELLDCENEIVKIEDIYKLLQSINSLDWGDFYFFKDYPTNWEWSKAKKYPELIKDSNLLVRAIDTNYYFIHTKSVPLKNAILSIYFRLIENVILQKLENHVYPY